MVAGDEWEFECGGPARATETGDEPSGVDKGELRPEQLLSIDENARIVSAHDGKPSDESLLHLRIVKDRGAGAVLHTHSVWNTILSDLFAAEGGVTINGYEMLKGLQGVRTHEHTEFLPIIENSQDMPALAELVGKTLERAQAGAWFSAATSRSLLLGPDACRSEAAYRDSRVSARNNGTDIAHPGQRRSRRSHVMAVVTICNENKTLTNIDEITTNLAPAASIMNAGHRHIPIADNAPAEEILQAYSREIEDSEDSRRLCHGGRHRC